MVREMEKPLDFGSKTRHGADIRMPLRQSMVPR